MFITIFKIIKAIFAIIFLIYISSGIKEIVQSMQFDKEKECLLEALDRVDYVEDLNYNTSIITTLTSSDLYLVLNKELVIRDLLENNINRNGLNLLKDGFEEEVDGKVLSFVNVKAIDENDLKLLLSAISKN